MIFITEDDLRDLYKAGAFTEYDVAPGTRITPGARQFLADRQIVLYDAENPRKKAVTEKPPVTVITQAAGGCQPLAASKVKSVEALFLVVAEELLGRDILLAQKVITLKKNFAQIRETLNDGKPCEPLGCEACSGISEENYSEDLGDCFEITEFHIQLSKGKEIIHLHRLRCALRELQLELPMLLAGDEDKALCEGITGTVNQIINTISQLICCTAGGEKCQR